MKVISIIMPVYNAEKYLEKTLQALSLQTYSAFEVIMIDDGSTDLSGEICKRYSEEDGRFRYYKVENGGPSKARNIGIQYAIGDYIGFCDSDDIPNPDMYNTLIGQIEKNGSQIALCDIYSERNNSSFGFPWRDGTVFENDMVKDELVASMIGNQNDDTKESPVWGSVVRCVFLHSIISQKQIIFPEDIAFAEDLVFTLRYLQYTQSAVICNEPLYFYTCNDNSIMNSYFTYKQGMFEGRIRLVNYILDVIRGMDADSQLENRLAVTERCYYHECVGNACRESDGRSHREMLSEIRRIVSNERVRITFSNFKVKDMKKKVIYELIKYKQVGLLYAYYRFRFH